MDLLQLVNAGIENCLAISGTAFTNGHALLLQRYSNKINVVFDGDEAGKKAALRCGYILLANSISQSKIITAGLNENIKIYDSKATNKSITAEEIIEHCKKYLTSYKIPKFIEFIDEIPKSNIIALRSFALILSLFYGISYFVT